MLRRHSPIVLFAALALACAPAADAPSQAEVDAVRAVIEEEVRALKAGDADGFIAIHTDDAVAIPPNEPAVAGDANRQWSRDFFEQLMVQELSYVDDDFVIAGDWAMHRYSFSWTVAPKAGGDAISETGAGLHILRRQADGSWKLAIDIWSLDAPPAGM